MAFGGLDRQFARALQRLFGLPQVGIGAARGAEWADVEHSEQVETMQLRRKLKPRLSRVAVQMVGRRRTFVSARRLGRDAGAALAGIALDQAEMRVFRRRTGHESLLFRPQTEQSTTALFRLGRR